MGTQLSEEWKAVGLGGKVYADVTRPTLHEINTQRIARRLKLNIGKVKKPRKIRNSFQGITAFFRSK